MSLALLLRLYDAAMQLPGTQSGNDVSDCVSHDDWEAMRSSIADRLPRDAYWEIYEPFAARPNEAVAGSLSDDLADIWRDLTPGLRRDDRLAAVWNWRFGFTYHWGRHTARAIAVLSALACEEPRPAN